MNVTVENLGPCKKLVRIELDAAAVNKVFDEMTVRYSRAASLPGFRPGKAPRAMVEKKFGKDIEDEVKRKVIPDSYREAIDSQKLRVVGAPDIEEIQFGRGQALQFAATVETEPEFTLPNYLGISVKLQPKSVTQEDVERAVELLRDRKGQMESVHRAIQEGDVAVVNYHGTCEGRPITDWAPAARGLTEQKAFWIEINPNSFIPGFGPQLVGRLAGDKQTVEVEFAADFVTPEVAEKKGVFEVEIVDVKHKNLPALDDAFAKTYGAATLEALRAGVWKDLEKELAHQNERDTRNQITRCLIEQVQCDLPEMIVTRETRKVVYNIVDENRRRGIAPELIDEKKDDIFGVANATAKERVKLAFIFQKIAEKENIKASQQEVIDRLHKLAQSYQMPVERFVKQLERGGGVEEIYEQIASEKVMALLLQNAKLEALQIGAGSPV